MAVQRRQAKEHLWQFFAAQDQLVNACGVCGLTRASVMPRPGEEQRADVSGDCPGGPVEQTDRDGSPRPGVLSY